MSCKSKQPFVQHIISIEYQTVQLELTSKFHFAGSGEFKYKYLLMIYNNLHR